MFAALQSLFGRPSRSSVIRGIRSSATRLFEANPEAFFSGSAEDMELKPEAQATVYDMANMFYQGKSDTELQQAQALGVTYHDYISTFRETFNHWSQKHRTRSALRIW